MKYIVTILRILVGLLFIFSGLIKSNDPTGFGYKLDEYFSVFGADMETAQDSLRFTITDTEGTKEKAFVIVPNASERTISITNSPWAEIVVDAEANIIIYVSTASIKVGGQELYQTDINAEDTGSVVHQVQLTASVNQDKLLTENIEFKSFVSNDKSYEISTKPYIKENSWIVGFLYSLKDYALFLAIFICVIEIILGVALLIGWAPRFTIWMLLLMIIFFTFLTWYSATFDKVTDCGCFGDAIKLTPKESFYKDLILSVAIIIIFIGRKHIKPVFSNPFSVRMLTICTLIVTGFSIYCWYYLPVKNFLKFKVGNNIAELMTLGPNAKIEIKEYQFIYKNAEGDIQKLNTEQVDTKALAEAGYEYVDREEVVIQEGDEPEIHDFKMIDADGNNHMDEFLDSSTWKIMIVIEEVENANMKAIKELKSLAEAWQKSGHQVYALTASDQETVESFRHENQLAFNFYWGDRTNLKSIIRSNPGLLVLDGPVVKGTWPSTRLPDTEDLLKMVK